MTPETLAEKIAEWLNKHGHKIFTRPDIVMDCANGEKTIQGIFDLTALAEYILSLEEKR